MPAEIPGTVVVFGDSLSDPGNLAAQAEGLIDEDVRQAFGGPNGQLSNGPVWVENLDALLGFDESFNYAVAGAQAIGSISLGEFLTVDGAIEGLLVPPDDPALDWDINLGAQIDRFQADFVGQDLGDFTALIAIGANDLANIDLSRSPLLILAQAAATVASLAESAIAAAAELAASGVGHIVITSIPSLDFFPALAAEDPAIQALANTLSAQANAALQDGVELLESQGISAGFLDLAPVIDAILDDQESFGLIAPNDLTLTQGDPAALAAFDEDQVAFWDPVHPTAATHGVIAAYSAYALENEVTILTDEADVLWTGAEDNLAFGYGGADIILGGRGDDLVFGGSDADRLSGDRGGDLVSGGSGDDLILGRRGDDVLDGDSGDDLILAGAGNDVIIDGLGSDRLYGGDGDDVFIWTEAALIGGTAGTDADVIRGGAGEDIVYMVLSADSFDLLASEIEGAGETAALASLGLSVTGTEDIVVVDGRAALEGILGGASWYGEADIWGLV